MMSVQEQEMLIKWLNDYPPVCSIAVSGHSSTQRLLGYYYATLVVWKSTGLRLADRRSY